MSLLEQLQKLKDAQMSNVDKTKVYVFLLYSADKLYHFDDDPTDIIDHNSNLLFSKEEADMVRQLTDLLYDEELFSLSLKLGGME